MISKKYHYVYRITNIVTKMYYYGDRSCNCHPSEDIGKKYFSSFTNIFFKEDQLINPQDYKYKVIKIFETCREDAKQLEVDLHKKFDVKNHPKFINRANQELIGFSFDNYELLDYISIGRKTKETRIKNGSYLSGAKKGAETKHKTNTHKESAKKSALTRKETICDNGLSLQENITMKIKKTMNETNSFGKTKYELQGEKLSDYLTQMDSKTNKTYGEMRIENLHQKNKIIGYDTIAKKVAETKKTKYMNVFFLIYDNNDKLMFTMNYFEFKERKIEGLPYSRLKQLMVEWKQENGFNQKAIIDIPFKTKRLNILKGKNTIYNGYYLVKEVRS